MTELTEETGPIDEPGAPQPIGTPRQSCAITGAPRPRRDLIDIDTLRPRLTERIRRDFPELPANAMISSAELARYRQVYVEESLLEEHGEVTELDRQVAESIANADTLAENAEAEYEETRTLGEVLSDHVASFGGSWSFIIFFMSVMIVWMAFNLIVGDKVGFDPYPFILLNLVLSTLAAVQAPIIMMSQKRQEAKDRIRSLNDYQINLKAELEIRHLHEKLDYLINKQWARLTEIQQMQLEIMQEKKLRKK